MAERSRAARKCSAAKIASATASKTGPSTKTLPMPEAAANRALTRKSPVTSEAIPAPIIPQVNKNIDISLWPRRERMPDQYLSYAESIPVTQLTSEGEAYSE